MDALEYHGLSVDEAVKLYSNVDERITRSIFLQFAQEGLFLKVDRAILTDYGERFMKFIREN